MVRLGNKLALHSGWKPANKLKNYTCWCAGPHSPLRKGKFFIGELCGHWQVSLSMECSFEVCCCLVPEPHPPLTAFSVMKMTFCLLPDFHVYLKRMLPSGPLPALRGYLALASLQIYILRIWLSDA